MKKVIVILALLTLLGSLGIADTLYLKNGSVLKGTFVGYENGEFIFEVGGGGRVKFPPGEVSRVIIERDLISDKDRDSDSIDSGRPVLTRRGSERRNPEPADSERRDSDRGEPERSTPERVDRSGRILSRGGGESAASVEVRLEGQWVRSQIQVSPGQRVRVEARGTIYLEGSTPTGPEGLSGRRDPEAPMPDENDGGLIAAIGKDSDSPSIFIGRSGEFTADREGLLYFTVNHWETKGARGCFNVNVSVDRSTGRTDGARETGNQRREKTVIVQANQPWTDTGIDARPNMTFEIVAEGQIDIGRGFTSGPDGNRNAAARTSNYPLQEAAPGALIGKIRYQNGTDSNYVLVGSSNTPTTEPDESGRLFLGINDDNLRDNRGAFTVRIRW